MWMFMHLWPPPHLSPGWYLFSILLSLHPSSFCILVSSLRGGLFDRLPAPLFWPQSSNPPPFLLKHLRVWQVRERWHSPDTPRHPFRLPPFAPVPPPRIVRSTSWHSSSTSTFVCHPLSLFFPPSPSPVFPSALTFIPSSPLSGCRSSLYPSHLFLFCPFPIYGSFSHSLCFCPLFFLSAVTSNSKPQLSSLLSSLFGLSPTHTITCTLWMFLTSLRTIQRRPSGSHPLLILTSQTQRRLLHSLSSLTSLHLCPFIHPFKSCTKCPVLIFQDMCSFQHGWGTQGSWKRFHAWNNALVLKESRSCSCFTNLPLFKICFLHQVFWNLSWVIRLIGNCTNMGEKSGVNVQKLSLLLYPGVPSFCFVILLEIPYAHISSLVSHSSSPHAPLCSAQLRSLPRSWTHLSLSLP